MMNLRQVLLYQPQEKLERQNRKSQKELIQAILLLRRQITVLTAATLTVVMTLEDQALETQILVALVLTTRVLTAQTLATRILEAQTLLETVGQQPLNKAP